MRFRAAPPVARRAWVCLIDWAFRPVGLASSGGRLSARSRTIAWELFPALLFFVALASFFPIDRLTDHVLGALDRFAPPEVLSLIRDQFLQISQHNNGGLLTLGLVGTIWSASSGMSSVIGALNQAYHVQEARSWWRVRLVAILLSFVLAAFMLVSFALVLVGPAVAATVAERLHLGLAFGWTWKVLQWPLVLALVAVGVVLVYYVAPDVQQPEREAGL